MPRHYAGLAPTKISRPDMLRLATPYADATDERGRGRFYAALELPRELYQRSFIASCSFAAAIARDRYA